MTGFVACLHGSSSLRSLFVINDEKETLGIHSSKMETLAGRKKGEADFGIARDSQDFGKRYLERVGYRIRNEPASFSAPYSQKYLTLCRCCVSKHSSTHKGTRGSDFPCPDTAPRNVYAQLFLCSQQPIMIIGLGKYSQSLKTVGSCYHTCNNG